MAQVTIKIGSSNSLQHIYAMSNEKIKYLLKFANSISEEEVEDNNNLLKEIETGLKQVKQIQKGMLPKKTLKQMLNGK